MAAEGERRSFLQECSSCSGSHDPVDSLTHTTGTCRPRGEGERERAIYRSCMHIYVSVYIWICVCMSVYIYIYTHIYRYRDRVHMKKSGRMLKELEMKGEGIGGEFDPNV